MLTDTSHYCDPKVLTARFSSECRIINMNSLARWALGQIDLSKVTCTLRLLDQPIERRMLIPELSQSDYQYILSKMADDKSVRNAVRMSHESKPASRAVTLSRLEEHLEHVWLLHSSCSIDDLLPELWAFVARQIEQDLLAILPSTPEWQVHNRLLLIEFFRNCRLNTGKFVEQQLESFREPIFSIRGSLTRIPKNVPQTDNSIDAPAVPKEDATRNWDSILFQAAPQASNDLDTGEGLLIRISGDREGHWLDGLNADSKTAVINGRKRSFRLHEANASVLIFAAASEQIIRSHAERHGIAQFQSNHPVPAIVLAKRLRSSGLISKPAFSAVNDLFGSTALNLRNRTAHGAMVDTESKWLESVLDHGGELEILPYVNWNESGSSPYATAESARNLFVCISNQIDAPPDQNTSWTEWFGLREMTDHGAHLPLDLVSNWSQATYWSTEVHRFLNAAVPVVDLFNRTTTISWLQDSTPKETGRVDFVIGLFFGLTVFETLYRTVAQAMGYEVLQICRTKDRMTARYRVLGTDNGGLAREEILRAICTCADPTDLENAIKTLRLAIKFRDLAIHGALFVLSEDERLALGNLHWKAIQILCVAAKRHMIREAAYFSDLNREPRTNGLDVEDWLRAELVVDNLIRDRDESPRKYATLRSLGLIMPDQFSSLSN